MSIHALKPSDRSIEIITKIAMAMLAVVLIVSALITVSKVLLPNLAAARAGRPL